MLYTAVALLIGMGALGTAIGFGLLGGKFPGKEIITKSECIPKNNSKSEDYIET